MQKKLDIDPSLRALIAATTGEVISQLRQGDVPLQPEYLTTHQVAQLTSFTAKSLETMRARRMGPAFLRVGGRIRYRIQDVRNWLEGGEGIE